MKLLLVLIPFLIIIAVVLAVLSWRLTAQAGPTSKNEFGVDPSDLKVGVQYVDEVPEMEFTLTNVARDKVRELMLDMPDATHLIVSLNYNVKDDYIYHYNLSLGSGKSPEEFVFLKSNGIDVAVFKDSIKALNGTKLDWVERDAGVRGFEFHNPNTFDWRELRKVSIDETRHIDPAVEAARLLTPQRQEAYERLRLWWLANESESGILQSEEIALVESYTVDGEVIYVIFSDVPGKHLGGFCLVNARGRTIPVYSGNNYLSEHDKFIDINGDGIPEMVCVHTMGGTRPDNPKQIVTQATTIVIIPIHQNQQPLLRLLFDKRKFKEPAQWTWELDTSNDLGATIRLFKSPKGSPIAEFVWQPEEGAFSYAPGSRQDGFIARAGHLPSEVILPFIEPED